MGRRSARIITILSLSADNGEQDAKEAQLAEEMAQRMRAITDEPQYRDIVVFHSELEGE